MYGPMASWERAELDAHITRSDDPEDDWDDQEDDVADEYVDYSAPRTLTDEGRAFDRREPNPADIPW